MPAQWRRQTPTRPTLFPEVPPRNSFEALEPEGEVSEDAGADLPARLSRVINSTPPDCLHQEGQMGDGRR